MHRIERLEIIQEYVTRNGKAEVSQLASIAGVSEATVRRDLTFLAGQKKIVRSHGGAVLNENLLMDESPFEYRVSYNRDRKLVIARAALQFVQPRSTCFFDCSSTVNELAKLITDQKFVAVTDTMWTAIELNKKENVSVIMLGGTVSKSTGSSAGTFAISMLEKMQPNYAFIGIPSITEDGVLSVSGLHDYEIKTTILKNTEHVFVLADSSKYKANRCFMKIGDLAHIDAVITDKDIDPEFEYLCKSSGCKLVIAQ